MAEKKGYGVGDITLDIAKGIATFYGGVEQKAKQTGAYLNQMGTDFMKIWNPQAQQKNVVPIQPVRPFPQHPDIMPEDVEKYKGDYLEGKIPTTQWPEMIRTLKTIDAQQGAK